VGIVEFIMVARLFEKVEQILAGDVFQKQKQKGGRFKSAMESDNVGMQGQWLMYGDLGHLYCQGILVEVGLGEALDGEFATVHCLCAIRGLVIKLHMTDGGHVAILWHGWTIEDLLNEIDNCIAAGAKLLDDLELLCWLLTGRLGRSVAVGHKADGLSLEIEALANDVSRD
jgi:hypothetical protein